MDTQSLNGGLADTKEPKTTHSTTLGGKDISALRGLKEPWFGLRLYYIE